MRIKKFIFSILVFLVILGVFDMLCFWLVDDYTRSFYISVGFANASTLVFALSTLLMMRKGRYIYLSIQDGFIIGGYVIVCLILNLCFVLCHMNDSKINIIVNVVILAVYLILLFAVYANTAAIKGQLEHDRKDRNRYYALKDRAQELLGKGNNIRINKRLESMYDRICSCQINRATKVSDIDKQIISELAKLETSLDDGTDETLIMNRIDDIIKLVDERDRRITNSLKR